MTMAAMMAQHTVLNTMVGRFAPQAIRLMRVPTGYQSGNDDAAQGYDAGDGNFDQEDDQQHGTNQRLSSQSCTGTNQHAPCRP